MEKKKLFLVVSAVAVFLCIVSTAIAVFPLITGKYKNADKAYSESVDECLEYSFNLDDLNESLDEEELRLNLARAGYGTNSSEARAIESMIGDIKRTIEATEWLEDAAYNNSRYYKKRVEKIENQMTIFGIAAGVFLASSIAMFVVYKKQNVDMG